MKTILVLLFCAISSFAQYSQYNGTTAQMKACIFIYPRTLATATNSLQWQVQSVSGSISTLPQSPDTLRSGVLTENGSAVQGSLFAWDSLAMPNSINDANSAFAVSFYQILTRGIIPTYATPTNNNNVASNGGLSGLAMNSFRFQRYYRLITY